MQTDNMSVKWVLAVRDHVEDNVYKQKIVVKPQWDENYKPIPLDLLVKSQGQQNHKYKRIEPRKQGAMQNRHGKLLFKSR